MSSNYFNSFEIYINYPHQPFKVNLCGLFAYKNVDYWCTHKLNNFICGGRVSMTDRKSEARNFMILLSKLMFEEFFWYKVYGSFNQ